MKPTYIALLIGLVVIVGGYFWVGSGNKDMAMEEGADAMMGRDDSMAQSDSEFSGSLQDLAKRGGDYKCTFTHDSDVAISSGTVYISDDTVRGDFVSKTQGITAESHMIAKGGYTYTWSPLTPTGFKAKVVEGEGDGAAAMQGGYADMQQSYNYNCKQWSADSSLFEVPAITFIDVSVQ